MRPSIATRGNLDLIEEELSPLGEESRIGRTGSWRAFFEGFELGNTPQRNGAAAVAAPTSAARARESAPDPRSMVWSTLIARSGTPSRG